MILALMPMCFVACGSDDDEGGSSSNSQLIGTWYEYGSSYIHAYCFNAGGTGWEGEWRKGEAEEHEPRTWKVAGNRLLIYNPTDGDLTDDLIYSISADGRTLTLMRSKDGSLEGVFTKK